MEKLRLFEVPFSRDARCRYGQSRLKSLLQALFFVETMSGIAKFVQDKHANFAFPLAA